MISAIRSSAQFVNQPTNSTSRCTATLQQSPPGTELTNDERMHFTNSPLPTVNAPGEDMTSEVDSLNTWPSHSFGPWVILSMNLKEEKAVKGAANMVNLLMQLKAAGSPNPVNSQIGCRPDPTCDWSKQANQMNHCGTQDGSQWAMPKLAIALLKCGEGLLLLVQRPHIQGDGAVKSAANATPHFEQQVSPMCRRQTVL